MFDIVSILKIINFKIQSFLFCIVGKLQKPPLMIISFIRPKYIGLFHRKNNSLQNTEALLTSSLIVQLDSRIQYIL